MVELCADLEGLGSVDAIKVTGSNGKGSVAAMTAAILDAAGVGTGLYTSPHLFTFHERIAIAGRPISEEHLASSLAWLGERLARRPDPDERVAFFEAATALALHHFARHRPAAVVAEGGIGGRYDPTRILPGSLTALVSLDYEHTALLGRSLEEIAYDKCDLASEGSTLVVGSLPPGILGRLRAYCGLRRVRVVAAEDAWRVERSAFTPSGMVADLALEGLRFDDLEIGLWGAHQVTNAAIAVVLAREWLVRHRPRLSAEDVVAAVRSGLRSVVWPGRCERVGRDPDVFVDVGHTPGAIAALVDTITSLLGDRRLLVVTGVSANREARSIVHPLVDVADRVVSTRASHLGRSASEIAELVAERRPEVPCRVEERLEQAVARAVEEAAREAMAVLVAGGLFVAAEAVTALRGGDPEGLRFPTPSP